MPDPERASTVEVRFHGDGETTTIELEHSGFERHDGDAAAYREALASEHGWPLIVERYVEAAQQ